MVASHLADDDFDRDPAVEMWERELDQLGPFASFESLIEHYAKAPAQCPSRQSLGDYISAHQFFERRKKPRP